jgi:hypothetical protein
MGAAVKTSAPVRRDLGGINQNEKGHENLRTEKAKTLHPAQPIWDEAGGVRGARQCF